MDPGPWPKVKITIWTLLGLNLDTLKDSIDVQHCTGILSTRSTNLALFGLNLDTLKAYRDVKHCTGIVSTRSTYLALFGLNLDTLKASKTSFGEIYKFVRYAIPPRPSKIPIFL